MKKRVLSAALSLCLLLTHRRAGDGGQHYPWHFPGKYIA